MLGHQAVLCMNDIGDTPPAAAEGICADIELEWWNARLNANYATFMDRLVAEGASRGTTAGQSAGSMVETYREAQHAWTPFRDAPCAFRAATIGTSGAARNRKIMRLMELTAARALGIEGTGSFYRD